MNNTSHEYFQLIFKLKKNVEWHFLQTGLDKWARVTYFDKVRN